MMVAPAWCRPLLARMPEVNQARRCRWATARWGSASRRRTGAPCAPTADRAYVLPDSFKSALVPSSPISRSAPGWRGRNALRPAERRRVLDKAAFPLIR
ncbi:hypothetical protein M8494_31920 [Serratia ureilytica]